MKICDFSDCTGCGMCSNICPTNAIIMTPELHGFVYPNINNDKCINCGLCVKKCPANTRKKTECNMKNIYAAWNTDKQIRKNSSSGGVCSLLEKEILKDGGAVVGVKWNADFSVSHSIAFNEEQAQIFRGSKYVQSDTGKIYIEIKELLENGTKVLFSGTPCQIAALKSFLGKDYDILVTVDLICHGVPPYEFFGKYLNEISGKSGRKISNINLRYKSPYWDYCSVRIDFEDGTYYQKYTVDDPYFTLFNIGYTLRESCHRCRYTTVHREGDITLADFWGYQPSGFKMLNYNKGTSLVSVNTDKGNELFERIKKHLVFEEKTLGEALKTNKSLSEPFTLPEDKTENFWNDYESGVSVDDLLRKYVPEPFGIPNLLMLRRIKYKYNWVIKHK